MGILSFWNLWWHDYQNISMIKLIIVHLPSQDINPFPLHEKMYNYPSNCNHKYCNWVWWCHIHHWHTTNSWTPSLNLQPSQVRRNYQHTSHHDLIHPTIHFLVDWIVHVAKNVCTLRTGPMASLCKPRSNTPWYWKYQYHRCRMKTSSQLMEKTEKSVWFIHQHWACTWDSPWSNYPNQLKPLQENWKLWFWKPRCKWFCWQFIHMAVDIAKIDDTIENPWDSKEPTTFFLNILKMPIFLPFVQIFEMTSLISSCIHWKISLIQVILEIFDRSRHFYCQHNTHHNY